MSNAKKIRQVSSRLAGRKRNAQAQSLRHQEGRAPLPKQDAAPGRRKKSPRLGSVAQICEAWAEAHYTSNNKVAARDLAALCGSIAPQKLTPLHFQSLNAAWKKRLQRGTVYLYTCALKNLVRHIGTLIARPDMVHQLVRARPADARKTIALPEEIEKLLATAPRWMKPIILLASDAALRRSDCLQAAPIHWNSEARVLTIRTKKTGETVSIPATERLAALLDNAPTGEPHTPFCELYRDKPVSKATLDHAWNTLKKKVGVNPDLWLHDLCRTIAVSLYEVSKDLRVVEQMLGHRSLSSTVRYLEHRDPAKLKPYLDAMFIPKGPVQ